MIPYFELHTIPIGPIHIQAWGTFVAAGFLVGAMISSRRAKAKGFDANAVWDMAFWVFIAAFVGARLFHALFYEPSLLGDLWGLINPARPGFAILGGFLGAASAFALFVKRKKLDFLKFADVAVWGLPWGVAIGRLGCFLIHDHPGTLSNSLLAVNYPSGARHDLGLYLSIVGLVMGAVFLVLNRKPRSPGFYFGAWILMEALSRIWLDFYRIADTRWFGLTPTQWMAIPLMIFGGWMIFSGKKVVKER